MEEPPSRPKGSREPGEGSPRRFRWRGFADAWNGLRLLVRTQPNARVHLAATIAAWLLAAFLRLSFGEWAALVTVTALVWVAEALNSAVEMIVDLVSPERQPLAGWAKDVAAGAVLLAAIAAMIVGMILFLPKLVALTGI
jgi:diacylglycerol kinase